MNDVTLIKNLKSGLKLVKTEINHHIMIDGEILDSDIVWFTPASYQKHFCAIRNNEDTKMLLVACDLKRYYQDTYGRVPDGSLESFFLSEGECGFHYLEALVPYLL